MLVHDEGELYLCADAVCTRNENGLVYTCKVKLEKAAEAADARKSAGDHGAGDVLLHELHRLIACGNVNACLLIAFGKTVVH